MEVGMTTFAAMQKAKKELTLIAYQMLTFLGTVFIASVVASQTWGVHLGWKTAVLTAVGTFSLLVVYLTLRDLFLTMRSKNVPDGFIEFILTGAVITFLILLGIGVSDAIPYIRTALG
ncbi:MAG: hypothetical protein AAB631_01265 [Patescibacteria group bacterium]